jgi:hypothetical protein
MLSSKFDNECSSQQHTDGCNDHRLAATFIPMTSAASGNRCAAFENADVVGHLLSLLYYTDTSMLAQTDTFTRKRVREMATFLHLPLYCLPKLTGGDLDRFYNVWPACKAAQLNSICMLFLRTLYRYTLRSLVSHTMPLFELLLCDVCLVFLSCQ